MSLLRANFRVILDSNVLGSYTLCDFFLRLADADMFLPCWTEKILTESEIPLSNANRRHGAWPSQRIERWKETLRVNFPDAFVTGYESLIESLILPDPDDRHVLAAAIVRNVQEIVTSNIKDFPNETLDQFGISANTPNAFANALYNHDPATVCGVLDDMAVQRSKNLRETISVNTMINSFLPKSGVTLEIDG